MADRVFVLASKEFADRCNDRARDWVHELNQRAFNVDKDGWVASPCDAVAEFLANEKGFTLYECNAKYPKSI